MKRIILQILLLAVILGLAYWLYSSINEPIQFNSDYKKRKDVVVEKLKDIRTMQVAYKSVYGKFTNSFDTLTNFYNNGYMKVVRQIGSMDDSLAVAQGRVKRDTISILVKDTIFHSRGASFNIANLGIVPYTNNLRFEMDTVTYITPSKIRVPLFEARVLNAVFLNGLNKQQIANLNDELKTLERYPGVKVGDINQPNNNAGNWE